MDLFDSILSQHKVGECVILSFRDVPKEFTRFLLNLCRKTQVPDSILENPDLAVRVRVKGNEDTKYLCYAGYNKTLQSYIYTGSAWNYPVYYVRDYVQEDNSPLLISSPDFSGLL